MEAVTQREGLELQDYLYRKRLQTVIYAFQNNARKKINARVRLHDARMRHRNFILRTIYDRLSYNAAMRRELKKDAIMRQIIDLEPGEDDFFTVQVKI